jgi:hypothetical protein
MASGRSSKSDSAVVGAVSPVRATWKAGVAVAAPTVWSGISPAATPPHDNGTARSCAEGGHGHRTTFTPGWISVHFRQSDRIQDHLTDDDADAILRSGTRLAWFFASALLVLAAVLVSWILSAGPPTPAAGEPSKDCAVGTSS